MSRTFKTILMFIVAVVSFIIFLLMSFPLDSIVSHFLASVEERTQGEFRITVENMQPSLLFASELEGVVISKKSQMGFEEIFATKHLEVNISLLSLISKTIDVNFSAQFADGLISGNFKSANQKNQLDVVLEKIDLEKLTFLVPYQDFEKLSLNTQGLLSGDVFVALSPQGLKDAEIEFNLRVQKLLVRNIKIKTGDHVLPDLVLSSAENPALFQGSLVSSQLRLHDIVLPGPDLDMQFKGKLNLKQEKAMFSIMRVDVKGRFAFSDPVLEAVPELGFLAEQKGTDGYYPLTVAGRFEKPSIRVGEMDLAPFLGM